MSPSITRHWNRIPPLFCYLIARENRRPMPLGEIAKRAGMSLQRAQWIYRQDSWDRVPMRDAEQFARACGLTMRNFHRQIAYLKTTLRRPNPLAHIEDVRPSTLKRITVRVKAALQIQ